MKSKSVNFVNRILAVVLVSLGFASCEPEQPEMYGCPITDYNEDSSVTIESDSDTVALENAEKE